MKSNLNPPRRQHRGQRIPAMVFVIRKIAGLLVAVLRHGREDQRSALVEDHLRRDELALRLRSQERKRYDCPVYTFTPPIRSTQDRVLSKYRSFVQHSPRANRAIRHYVTDRTENARLCPVDALEYRLKVRECSLDRIYAEDHHGRAARQK